VTCFYGHLHRARPEPSKGATRSSGPGWDAAHGTRRPIATAHAAATAFEFMMLRTGQREGGSTDGTGSQGWLFATAAGHEPTAFAIGGNVA